MSRRRKAQIRDVLPDPVHNSTVLTKFTNAIMLDGKKAVAESLINRSFTDIQSKTGESRSEERRVGKECRSRWSPYH